MTDTERKTRYFEGNTYSFTENIMRGHSSVTQRRSGWGGGVKFSGEKRYEGVRFNVISITRGWVGVKIPGN